LALALGVLAGATLVLSSMVFATGKFLLIPYALVVLGSLVAIRAQGSAAFSERSFTGLLAFVLSSLALFVSLPLSPTVGEIGFPGHAWRIVLLVGVGGLINLATARVASVRSKREGAPA